MGASSRNIRSGRPTRLLLSAPSLLFLLLITITLLLTSYVAFLLNFTGRPDSHRVSEYELATTSNDSGTILPKKKLDAFLTLSMAAEELESAQLHWDKQIDDIRGVAKDWQALFSPQEAISLFSRLGQQLQEVACRGKSNDCYDGASTNHKASEYLRLNLEHFNKLKAKGVQEPTYCETGFNYGKSAMAALLAGYKVYSFDVQQHAYSERAANLMEIIWPNKFVMTKGSSFDTIPGFHERNPNVKCNVLSIDGLHTMEGVMRDTKNLKAFSEQGSLVFIDDIGKTCEHVGTLHCWAVTI